MILAFLIRPDVQERAQREIDGVLEGKRLPDFEDMDRLPYVTAIAREVVRFVFFQLAVRSTYRLFTYWWQPVAPLGRAFIHHHV